MFRSPDPRQYLSEKLFLGKLLPKPKLYTKFEVASFNGCKNKLGVPNAPLTQTPINFGPESCFCKLLPVPKLCKIYFSTMCIMMTGTVCFEQKTTICNAKCGDLGDNPHCPPRGQEVKICRLKCHIWNRWLWFAFHYATFMGLQWWLRVVYSWVPTLLSIVGRKKLGPKFDGFGG